MLSYNHSKTKTYPIKIKEDFIMEVMRNMTIDTELFELGDIISFTLTTGEKVKARNRNAVSRKTGVGTALEPVPS